MNEEKTRMEPGSRLSKLRRYAQLAPKDPEVHLALARELVEGSQSNEAAAELQTVIALSPNHLEARKLLEGLIETKRR